MFSFFVYVESCGPVAPFWLLSATLRHVSLAVLPWLSGSSLPSGAWSQLRRPPRGEVRVKTWPCGQLLVLLSCDPLIPHLWTFCPISGLRRNLQLSFVHSVHWIFLRNCAPLVFAAPPNFQANEWKALSPGGSIPSARAHHTAVWSDVANGFYSFGGYDGTSLCLSVATLEQRFFLKWKGYEEKGTIKKRGSAIPENSHGSVSVVSTLHHFAYPWMIKHRVSKLA